MRLQSRFCALPGGFRPAFYRNFQKSGEKNKKVRNFCIKTRKHFLTVTDQCGKKIFGSKN